MYRIARSEKQPRMEYFEQLKKLKESGEYLLNSQEVKIAMEEGNNTVYLVAGYEISDEEQTTLLQEPAFNKYHTIAKSGLTAALKEYYAAATNAEKG